MKNSEEKLTFWENSSFTSEECCENWKSNERKAHTQRSDWKNWDDGVRKIESGTVEWRGNVTTCWSINWWPFWDWFYLRCVDYCSFCTSEFATFSLCFSLFNSWVLSISYIAMHCYNPSNNLILIINQKIRELKFLRA